jgi:hypothetical protein
MHNKSQRCRELYLYLQPQGDLSAALYLLASIMLLGSI